MPRFHVIAVDLATEEIKGYIARIDNPVDAVCNHPWFATIYRSEWVAANIWNEDLDNTISNIKQAMNWLILCVNLDDEIMNALNMPVRES